MTITTTSGSFLGNPVKRTEDRGLITGAARYTGDLPVDGAYHLVFVRSPIAHGTLGAVDVAEARALPGVKAVYTGDDLGLGTREGLPGVVPEAMARPFVVTDKVRFVGDIVAAVVGETAADALAAAEVVLPDIEPLPAVIN